MRVVRRSAIVPHTPAQMYAIVNDVRRYPEFVPWCPATRVFEETEVSIHAAVDVARAGVTLSVATRNVMVPGERIDLRLASGPLRTLEGSWRFVPIVARATPAVPGAVALGADPEGTARPASASVAAASPAAGGADDAGAAAAGPHVRGCRVELDVRFEFGNAALTALFGPMFEASWDSLVDVFVRRAVELHGPGR